MVDAGQASQRRWLALWCAMLEHPRRPIGWLVALAGALLGLGVGLAAFHGFPQARPTSQPSATVMSLPLTPFAAPLTGSPAPDFGLRDLEGNFVHLSDFRGSVVLVNFWATWCGPCEIEMPMFETRVRAHDDGALVVLGVDDDESEVLVRQFRDDLNLTFPVLLDPGGRIQSLYRVLGYPTSFFVDRAGVIRRQYVGLMTEQQIDDYLHEAGLP
jgi:peroxiredoxin